MGENGGPDLAPCGMDCALCEVRQREKALRRLQRR